MSDETANQDRLRELVAKWRDGHSIDKNGFHCFSTNCADELERLAAVPEVAGGAAFTPEKLAERFHQLYEYLAPSFGYKTREASAKPWSEVPENNHKLMTTVCEHILKEMEALAAQRADAPVPPDSTQICMDCGKPYALSLIFSREDWLRVNPQDAGMLCPTCMANRAEKIPHVLWIAGKVTFADEVPDAPVQAGAQPDYKPAHDEINKVRERAYKLLGGKYLGWNWVHALVDKLEKIEACTCTDDYRHPNCPTHGDFSGKHICCWERKNPHRCILCCQCGKKCELVPAAGPAASDGAGLVEALKNLAVIVSGNWRCWCGGCSIPRILSSGKTETGFESPKCAAARAALPSGEGQK